MGQLCSRKHSHLGRLTPKNGLRIHQIREMRSFDRYSTVASQIQQLCFIPPLTPNLVPIGRRKIACYEPHHPSLTPRSENGLEAMKTGCRNRSRHLGPHESNTSGATVLPSLIGHIFVPTADGHSCRTVCSLGRTPLRH